jgi:hypothetical protein
MANGTVVLYVSRFGKPLQTHHRVVLDLNAKAIAKLKGCKFGGPYDPDHNYSGPLFFVPTKQHVSAFVLRVISTAASCPIFS